VAEAAPLLLSVALVLGWFGVTVALWLWKGDLLRRTWREPYFLDTPVLIESDDWGPGGSFHADRLRRLAAMLEGHADALGRKPVFTADVVLAVPDTQAIRETGAYHRRYLDEAFPEIYQALRTAMGSGVLVPQLHGLEHLNSEAFMACVRAGDSRVADAMADPQWWDWEALDSPLQAHYVNGYRLPTDPEPPERVALWVRQALDRFRSMFDAPSLSTVAPCYLWTADVEAAWREQGVRFIQCAGYRCIGRDASGRYIQDPPLIRVGDASEGGQIHLVRNVMYEPVDGRTTVETAIREAKAAASQALPVTISTHRYNYTRTEEECRRSIAGLDRLLTAIERQLPRVRYLSSPELGQALAAPAEALVNPFEEGSRWPPLARLSGFAKVAPWLQRLRHRHPKLMALALFTGMILPLLVLWALSLAVRPRRC